MAKRKSKPGTLVRFVTRALSDKYKSYWGVRPNPNTNDYFRSLARTAVRAVARGTKRGCR